jgi:hypothetical protein
MIFLLKIQIIILKEKIFEIFLIVKLFMQII